MPPLRRLSSIAYGVQWPLLVADDHEIDRESAEHALPREALADRSRVGGDRRRVRRVGWKPAAEVASDRSARRAAGRGSRGSRPRRSGVTRTWTLGLRSSCAVDALFDDPTAVRQLRHVGVERRSRADSNDIDAHAAIAARRARRPIPGAGARSGRRPRCPLPDAALVELDDRLGGGRPRRPQRQRAPSTMSSRLSRPSRPNGCAIPSSANSRRQPVLVPEAAETADRPRTWGCPAASARSRSSGVVRVRDQVRERQDQGSGSGSVRAAADARSASRSAGAASHRVPRPVQVAPERGAG